ncbi:MAG: glutamine synthetase III [Eggerthellaceae bacterium]
MVGDGTAITKFSGKELIQGEPDASSFPNGGPCNVRGARIFRIGSGYAFIRTKCSAFPRRLLLYRKGAR